MENNPEEVSFVRASVACVLKSDDNFTFFNMYFAETCACRHHVDRQTDRQTDRQMLADCAVNYMEGTGDEHGCDGSIPSRYDFATHIRVCMRVA